jgi:hypothetical protein
MGGMSGITFKPLMMFGIELKDTRKFAAVMDVSSVDDQVSADRGQRAG